MTLKQTKIEVSSVERQVHVEEMWRGGESSYIRWLQEVSAMNDTGNIQEVLRYTGKNYLCRPVGENVPSNESGDCCWHSGAVKVSMSMLQLSRTVAGFSPAVILA